MGITRAVGSIRTTRQRVPRLVVEARDCFVHVFLPPLERLEKFIELVGLVDQGAQTGIAVILEGYGPPPDSRIKTLLITPDPE